jgi:positive regulator of sigma E activity
MLLSVKTIKKGLKYILQLIVIFMAAKFVPSKELDFKDVTIIAIIGAVSFAIIDMYSPSVSKRGQDTTGKALSFKTLLF